MNIEENYYCQMSTLVYPSKTDAGINATTESFLK